MFNRRTFLIKMMLGSLASIFLTSIINLLIAEAKNNRQQSLILYVSPEGNDNWSGKLASPNKQKKDGPLATVAKARDVIRGIKRQQGGNLKQPVTVFIRGGNYFLWQPLIFTEEDSGTANYPISYQAYGQEKPVISGGKIITNWQAINIKGKRVWMTKIPEVKQGKWFFRELWINGQRRTRARYPNKGYLKVARLPDVNANTPWNEGQTRFQYQKGELKNWTDIEQAEAVVMTRWLESRLPIVDIDNTRNLITLSSRTAVKINPGDLYYLENSLDILDSPGQWYLEKKSGNLYYIPLPGEQINKIQVIAPVLSQLVILKAPWQTGKFVEHLQFEKLNFTHCQWFYPQPREGIFVQAAYKVPGAIYAEGVRFCRWKNCQIARMSNYAIEFARICQDNQIINCELFDLGAGGIKISSQGNNKIINCHIHDGGKIFHSAVGIWIEASSANYIAYNHIHDFYYSGISLGWTWGYGENFTKNNILEFNHIHHLGLLSNGDGPLLNDKGGIYTLGVQPGTVIRNNRIHHIDAFNYGAWGIYLDEGSSEIKVENNLVYQTRDGGFHLHYGKNNSISNNIFALGKVAQIRRSAAENHLSFTFTNNIIYWRDGKLLEGKWQDNNFICDRNLYWQVKPGQINFGNMSWQEWQKKGKDRNSIIADPLFIAPQKGDFRLQSRSPSGKINFKSLNIKN